MEPKKIKRLVPGMIVKLEGIRGGETPSTFWAVVVSVENNRALVARGFDKTDWVCALDYPDCIQEKGQERVTEVAKGQYAYRKIQ